jgi:hypothetical protein
VISPSRSTIKTLFFVLCLSIEIEAVRSFLPVSLVALPVPCLSGSVSYFQFTPASVVALLSDALLWSLVVAAASQSALIELIAAVLSLPCFPVGI